MSEPTKNIILTLDIGSSSIRCTAYQTIFPSQQHSDNHDNNNDMNETCSNPPNKKRKSSSSNDNNNNNIQLIQMSECNVVQKVSTVCPNTGNINLWYPRSTITTNNTTTNIDGNGNIKDTFDSSDNPQIHLLDLIDFCIDQILSNIRAQFTTTKIVTQTPNNYQNCKNYCIVGISFSSLVMNLVGVNSYGDILPNATISYACNSNDVVDKCHALKRELGTKQTQEIYQRTGAPIHNAYAIGQLRVYYNNNSNINNNTIQSYKETEEKDQADQAEKDEVFQWLTISSLCVARWIGHFPQTNGVTTSTSSTSTTTTTKEETTAPNTYKFPISYSEASWTGLFNFRNCQWDEPTCRLLPSSCYHALPPLVDFNDSYYYTYYMYSNNDRNTNNNNQYGPTNDKKVPLSIQECRISTNGKTLLRRKETNPYWNRWPDLRGRRQDISSSTPSSTSTSTTSVPPPPPTTTTTATATAAASINEHGCRLYLGIGDGACASLGSKCTSSFRISCTIGTSAALRVIIPLPIQPCHTKEEKERNDDDDVGIKNDCETSELSHETNNDNNDDTEKNCSQDIVIPSGLFCYRINKSFILVGGALTDGGSIIEWTRKLTNTTSEDSFSFCLQDASEHYEQMKNHYIQTSTSTNNTCTSKSPSSTLSVIPFLSGERSTGFRGGATGCILGIHRETSASDLLCACLQGVVLRINAILLLMNHVIETIHDTSITPNVMNTNDNDGDGVDGGDSSSNENVIIASGNALEKNELWRQMLADCTGKLVIQDNDTVESSSRGAALLVARDCLSLSTSSSSNSMMQSTTNNNNVVSDTSRMMDDEALSILEEQRPHSSSLSMWQSLQQRQEDAIDCITPMW